MNVADEENFPLEAIGEDPKKPGKSRRRGAVREYGGAPPREQVPRGKGGNMKHSLAKKIEKCLSKIINHQYGHFYYNSSNPGEPCLSQVEKNLKNGKYKSTHDFIVEIRQIWTYNLKKNETNEQLYQQTLQMSMFSENAFKDMDGIPEDKGNLAEMDRMIDEIGKDIGEIKASKYSEKNIKKEEKVSEKPMGYQEKTELGNKIKLLKKDQLRGIVKLLTESNNIENNQKFFEFDIDKLSEEKLRELERYVNNCCKMNPPEKAPVKPPSSQTKEIDTLKKNLNSNKNTPERIANERGIQQNIGQETPTQPITQNSNQPSNQRMLRAPNEMEDSFSSSESDSDSLSSS
ncbi:MAG: bromodomain-containing protein [archaeon]|nr:bromodomain-containing protein [archaeon]